MEEKLAAAAAADLPSRLIGLSKGKQVSRKSSKGELQTSKNCNSGREKNKKAKQIFVESFEL